MKRMLVVWRWLPAILCMAVIFYFSHQPGSRLESYLPLFRYFFPWMNSFNWGHIVAYFALGIAVYFGLGPRWASWKGRLVSIAICTLYGITDEFHQTFVDGRTAQWLDIVNDAIGASLAMLLVSIPGVHRIYMKLTTKY